MAVGEHSLPWSLHEMNHCSLPPYIICRSIHNIIILWGEVEKQLVTALSYTTAINSGK